VTLRKLRESTTLSQPDVAERLGVTPQTVRNWEAGRSEPSLKISQVYELCQMYQCSLLDLVEAVAQTQLATSKQKRKRRQRQSS